MKDVITVVNQGVQIAIEGQASVLSLLIENNIDIDHSCGGFGTCGTCRIFVRSDLSCLEPRNEIEQERADDLGFSSDERLACQLCPRNGLEIEVP